VPGTKVKELTIEPKHSLTMQRHFDRSEYWHVTEGRCVVATESDSNKGFQELSTHNGFIIPEETWHKLSNPYDAPCKIVEIQYGIACVEDDIERR
jgi:mannose-1-phosphate guanylyltransferase/mannose-6-phosphate isomerase